MKIAKITDDQSYANFDGMTWPLAGNRSCDIKWKLRYRPHDLTREDQLLAASILSAYRQMVADSQGKRNHVISRLREANLVVDAHLRASRRD